MYKVLVTFSGLISATKGQIIEISNKEIAKDLVEAKYVEEIKKHEASKKTGKNSKK